MSLDVNWGGMGVFALSFAKIYLGAREEKTCSLEGDGAVGNVWEAVKNI